MNTPHHTPIANVQTTVRVPRWLVERLDEAAQAQMTSRGSVIRMALAGGLKHLQPEPSRAVSNDQMSARTFSGCLETSSASATGDRDIAPLPATTVDTTSSAD